MTHTILAKLAEIEEKYGVKILFACESGSRGWEFASPDSDYDVRFIFVQQKDLYLSIEDPKDQLSFAITDELDVYGWDIRKVLQLIRKSNTTPFEWLQSPIIYKEEPGFRENLWALCQDYFSPRANIHHYLGIAKGAIDTLTEANEIKIKKLFYVLRPLLAAKWCLEKNSIAPMRIAPLMTLLPSDLRLEVQQLIEVKAGAAEGFIIHLSDSLKTYIKEEMEKISELSKDLPKEYFGIEALNRFFVDTISET